MKVYCINSTLMFKGRNETVKRNAERGSFYMGSDTKSETTDDSGKRTGKNVHEKHFEDEAAMTNILIARINASDEKDVDAQIGLGDVWFKKGYFSDAASQYQIAIGLLTDTDKRIPDIYKKMILSFIKSGYPVKAAENMKRFFDIPLKDADSYNNRGVILARLGSHSKILEDSDAFKMALADFQRAIKLDCEYATAYFNKAKVHYILGEVVKYRDNILKALELYDKQKDTKNYYQCLKHMKERSVDKHKTRR